MPAARFTIKGLMIAVAVVAAILALFQHNTFIVLIVFYAVALALAGWLPTRGRPRLAAWAFFASAAWLNLSMLFFFAYYPAFHNEILWFMASMVFLPIVPGAGLAWTASRPDRRRKLGAAAVAFALTALPVSMIATRWPVRLAFRLSAPALERLADRVEAGGQVVPGEWAGLYRVWGTIQAPRPGEFGLLIDTDPNGRFAFVRRKHPLAGGSGWQVGEFGPRWDTIDED